MSVEQILDIVSQISILCPPLPNADLTQLDLFSGRKQWTVPIQTLCIYFLHDIHVRNQLLHTR